MNRSLEQCAGVRPGLRRLTSLLGGLGAAGLLLGGAVVPTASASGLADDRERVHDKLAKADRHLDESSAELDAATTALLQARADLNDAQAHLATTQGDLAAAEALDAQMQLELEAARERLREARLAVERGRADVTAQEAQLRRIVVNSYQQGDPQLMGLSRVLTTQDPAQLAGDMNATSTVIDQQAALLDSLEAARVLLEVKESEVQAAKAEVAKQRRAAAANLLRKAALERQAEEAAQQVEEMVDLRVQARATAMKAKDADLAELEQLQAERDRIQELIRKQASHTDVLPMSAGVGGGPDFLDVPVDGSMTSPYGWRVHPIWGYRSLHDGVDYGAACGAHIRASASGTVISEYFQSAWGNRIIVDHGVHRGVGLATISNHLSSYAVEVGDDVRRGEVIGYVGTTGWSTGCHLHYTVMENGVPVDPMRWF